MSDHRAVYLALIDEYRRFAKRVGMPGNLQYELDEYMAADLDKRAVMLLSVERLVGLVRKLLADVDFMEPEAVSREPFRLPLVLALRGEGRACIEFTSGEELTYPPVPVSTLPGKTYAYIVECVNACESKRKGEGR